MELRQYQRETVDATWDFLRENPDKNPVFVVPTGGGKTAILSTLCREAAEKWDGRAILLTHVAELCEQLHLTLSGMFPPGEVGLYSAGLGSRETEARIVVAQIQSASRLGAARFGRRDLVFVDEVQMVPHSGDGQYRTFLAECRGVTTHARLIGATATPYRLDSGPVCDPDGLFHEICHEVGVKELIAQGFLSPLVSRCGNRRTMVDLSGVSMTGGDWNLEQLGAAMSRGSLVPDTVEDILERAKERKSILVFCPTIAHGELVLEEFRSKGQPAGFIHAGTGGLERGWMVDEFRRGLLRVLVNCQALTIGFDAPNVDCVCLLRPTESAGLFVQMVGRGFRLSPQTGKTDCLILDYAGLLNRHGPVDRIESRPRRKGKREGREAPTKLCGECREPCHLAAEICPWCGEPFPEPDPTPGHGTTPDELPVVSDDQPESVVVEIGEVTYSKHLPKDRGDGKPRIPSMKVNYYAKYPDEPIPLGIRRDFRWPVVSEWICFDHTGFARTRAEKWWRIRSDDPVPDSVEAAIERAGGGALAETVEVTIRRKDRESFPEITKVKLGPKPAIEHDPNETAESAVCLEDLPF